MIKKTLLLLTTLIASQGLAFEIKAHLAVPMTDCLSEPVGLTEGQIVEIKVGISEKDMGSLQKTSANLEYDYYISTSDFKLDPKISGQDNILLKSQKSSTYKFKIPALKDDISEGQILFTVLATKSNGEQATDSIKFPVTRKLVFKRSNDNSKSCYQIKPAEIISGIYINQNDTDTTITTTEGVQRTVEQRVSKTKGWSIMPSLFKAGFGISLFGFNSSHMTSLALQVSESSFTSVANVNNSGDAGFLYNQTTRFKKAFDVYTVNGCGTLQLQGLAFLEIESTITNFHKVDQTKSLQSALSSQAYGQKPENTCSEIDKVTVEVR